MNPADNPRYRRILVQMDTSTHCLATLDAAIDIAARLQAELSGLFVEDRNLISVGRLDFVREFSLSSSTARPLDDSTLDVQLKALARSARRQLESAGTRRNLTVAFRTVREDSEEAVEIAAGDVDLIIAEGTGRLHTRTYRAQLHKRYLSRSARRPTLLLKGGKPLAKRFVIICDSVDNARRCLDAAYGLSAELEGEFILVPVTESEKEAEELTEEIKNLAEGIAPNATLANASPADAKTILAGIGNLESLLIIADTSPLLQSDGNVRALFESRHPLLLVQ
jgi:nucleotide-binding universal stress UspA family protein